MRTVVERYRGPPGRGGAVGGFGGPKGFDGQGDFGDRGVLVDQPATHKVAVELTEVEDHRTTYNKSRRADFVVAPTSWKPVASARNVPVRMPRSTKPFTSLQGNRTRKTTKSDMAEGRHSSAEYLWLGWGLFKLFIRYVTCCFELVQKRCSPVVSSSLIDGEVVPAVGDSGAAVSL